MDATSFTLIAHDLKNALGSLESELEALIDDPSPVAAQSAYLHCTDLRRQFVQFLTVYGAADGLKVHCEDESPQDLLRSMHLMAVMRRLKSGQGPAVQLGVDHDGLPPFWYFDRRLVHMGLDAALHNALRFARETVTLSARTEDGYLVFVIDDDGPGLGSHDPSQASTGLGTNLCEAIAQSHANHGRTGRIALSNRPEGGARFELWLP